MLALAVIIQKADHVKGIWYAWVLESPLVVPSLVLISAALFMAALAKNRWVGEFYWKVFRLLIAEHTPWPPFHNFPDDVRLEAAIYGTVEKRVDVTDRVRGLLARDPSGITVAVKDLVERDPSVGVHKCLTVTFSTTQGDGDRIQMPISQFARHKPEPLHLTSREQTTYNALKTEFDQMPWCEKLALYIIYKNPPKIQHLSVVTNLHHYGYGNNSPTIVNAAVRRSSFVKQDADHDIEIHPGHTALVEHILKQWKEHAL